MMGAIALDALAGATAWLSGFALKCFPEAGRDRYSEFSLNWDYLLQSLVLCSALPWVVALAAWFFLRPMDRDHSATAFVIDGNARSVIVVRTDDRGPFAQ